MRAGASRLQTPLGVGHVRLRSDPASVLGRAERGIGSDGQHVPRRRYGDAQAPPLPGCGGAPNHPKPPLPRRHPIWRYSKSGRVAHGTRATRCLVSLCARRLFPWPSCAVCPIPCRRFGATLPSSRGGCPLMLSRAPSGVGFCAPRFPSASVGGGVPVGITVPVCEVGSGACVRWRHGQGSGAPSRNGGVGRPARLPPPGTRDVCARPRERASGVSDSAFCRRCAAAG